ncbi:MAG: SDR family oxidoreductase [Caulobacteraceae bacterium]|nr:SDR family oxidoreductase [Caulobacteraceae bacterium]
MRNVLITGASRGLGLAMTRRLAKDGYRVLAVARKSTDELAALIAETGDAVHFRSYDLLDIDGIPALVRELRDQFGPIYGLVNNAGIGTGGLLANITFDQIDTLIRLNTLSPIMLTKAVCRSMMAQSEGRIVNISSIVGSNGYTALSVYGATKASLLGFTKSLAREMGRVGVTVNAVAPGFIETDMTSDMSPEQMEQIAKRSALRRLADAEDAAAAVAYLISDEARNITGVTLTVDAGGTV